MYVSGAALQKRPLLYRTFRNEMLSAVGEAALGPIHISLSVPERRVISCASD